MKRYVSIVCSAFFIGLFALACQVSAASITETKAAIGKACNASGDNSTAMGYKTTASGDSSTAMGSGTTAIAYASTAMGTDTTANGFSSTAIGYDTTASGDTSTAMGVLTTASGKYSTIIGTGFDDSNRLINNIENSFMVGFMANDSDTTPEFFVKDGSVGIGTKDPNELLEVAGDGRAFFGDGGGSNRKGLLIDGVEGSSAARIEAFDYGTNTGLNLVLNYYGGNVGIGTLNPGQKLDIVSGNGRVQEGYNWLTNSDVRLKRNISTLDNSLEKVSRLRGVRFDSNKSKSLENDMGKHIGVVAQELEKEYPELVVDDDKTGYKAVAYDKLTAVLIEAVKELKYQNQSQKEVLEKQQAEIEELRLMIKELKS